MHANNYNVYNYRLYYIKYCLLFFTLLFVLCGLALVIIGSTINAIYAEFSYFLDINHFTPAVLLVATGFIIFGVACVGLYGALRESTASINIFGLLMGVIFVLQLAAGISCYFSINSIMANLREKINNSMSLYGVDSSAEYHMNYLQRNLYCCGSRNPSDWISVLGYVPTSCCYTLVDNVCEEFTTGCFSRLAEIITESSREFVASAYFLALMQIGGMSFAFYLARALRTQKAAREAQRWMLRDQLLSSHDIDWKAKSEFKS